MVPPSAFFIVLVKLAYKPHSVSNLLSQKTVIIYLGVLLLTPSCSLPGRQMGRAAPSPCLALLLAGFAWPATLLPPPVVSYTTVSPSPAAAKQSLAIYLSVALFRQVTLPGC